MKHLQSYNEGIFNLFRKGGKKPILRSVKKDDLYVTSNIGYKKRIGPSNINSNNAFYGIYFPEIKTSFIKDHFVTQRDFTYYGTAVFADSTSRYRPYTLERIEDIKSTRVWYDVGDLFLNLRNINKELGYDLNQKVNIISKQKDAKIIKIINVAFYRYTDGVMETIEECFTLLYKVEGDDDYYQIGQLDRIESSGDKNIVDSIVEENFLELIDDGLIEFSSEEFTQKGKPSYKCLVKVSKDMTPDILFKISECLLVASRRLNDMGIYIDIESMNHAEDRSGGGTTDIVFLAIQKGQAQ